MYIKEARKSVLIHFLYDTITQLTIIILFFQTPTFTGATSSIYGFYRNPKEYIIERFPQDTPKYVALRDLFLSQDKDVTPTDYKQPYESLYDFGFALDR